MCQPAAIGGRRCVAHTTDAYRQASPGNRPWFYAAVYYATTGQGQVLIERDRDRYASTDQPGLASNLEQALTIARMINDDDIANAESYASSKGREFNYLPPRHDDILVPPVDAHNLGEFDKAVLDLEAGRYRSCTPRSKSNLIYEDFGLNQTRYYQRLNRLADSPLAADYDPTTVRSLRVIRDRRKNARAGRTPAATLNS